MAWKGFDIRFPQRIYYLAVCLLEERRLLSVVPIRYTRVRLAFRMITYWYNGSSGKAKWFGKNAIVKIVYLIAVDQEDMDLRRKYAKVE